MPNNITSFDIGESQVKVVTLSGGSVKKAVALELPDNVVSGGTVLSMDALADFLKEKLRWRKQQGNERHCCLKKRRMRQDLKEQTMRIQPDILQKKALSSTAVR